MPRRNVTAEPLDPRERFGPKFNRILESSRSEGCWEWRGSRMTTGYGRYHKNYAHRLVYEALVGPIPEGAEVMHTCDNPPCVNPDHLRVGTHRENMLDAWHKGLITPPPSRATWTHCKRGHEFTEENTYRDPHGVRECRMCKRERRANHRARTGR